MNLRTRVFQGASFLILRQGLGMVIGISGVIALTRILGPAEYGVYAVALGVYTYLLNISQFGINVYLIRSDTEVTDDEYNTAATMLVAAGAVVAVIGMLLVPELSAWTGMPRSGSLMRVMLCGLPVNLLTFVPLAKLERGLHYKQVAAAELSALSGFYAVGITLAAFGAGAWAAVGGWWTQQLLLFLLVFLKSRLRLKIGWSSRIARRIFRYGFSYSSSIWVWQLRDLVNPLIVSRILGAEAVGTIALTIRLVDTLSFVKNATWRLSLAVLAKLQAQRERLAAAISEGMLLQLLSVGVFLVTFSAVAPWVMPVVFGKDWLPVLVVFPYIALSYLTNSSFNLHSSALYVVGENWKVGAFHAFHVAAFVGSASWLIPRIGIEGYGWAEVLAIPMYAVIHLQIRRNVGSIQYRDAMIVWVSFAVSLLAPRLGWPLFLFFPVPFFFASIRKKIATLAKVLLTKGVYQTEPGVEIT